MLRALSFALLLPACVEDVSTGKTEAQVSEPIRVETPADAPKADAVAAQGWAVDPASSQVKALGAKVTKQEVVQFPVFTGLVDVNAGKVDKITFEVDVTKLTTGSERLTGHLQSPDFFDTAKFPMATFVSTKIAEGATEAGMTHTVTGDLTMRGVTKAVTFPMAIQVSNEKVTAATEFAFNRQEWGIAYPGKPDDLVQDKVVLTVGFTAANPEVAAR